MVNNASDNTLKTTILPHWFKTAVVYQIYPRSFKDGNNDGVGDINGIIDKLDYLNNGTPHSLGVDAIWICPMYRSPMIDFGYDVTDHTDIDPLFGTLSDFDRLIKEAHKRNIKVIMDFIPGHTSDQHPWFLESKQSRTNPKRDWYIWKDPKPNGDPPNNWMAIFGGSRWEWHEETEQYYLHTFLKEQPDLNWRNKEVQEAMLSVLHFWLKRGVDGFRVDSFNDIYKDERYLDEPVNPEYIEGQGDPRNKYVHMYTRNQPERHALLRQFSNVLAQYEDKFLTTESYVELPELIKLYESGDSSHAPFNFQLIVLEWEAVKFKSFIDEFDARLSSHHLPTYVLGNHDNPRIASRIGVKAARTAALMQLTLRGMPTIYYGEEIGMKEVIIPIDKRKDPFTKKWLGSTTRDSQRTPMRWDMTEYAGFSLVEPWLPVGSDVESINVATEEKDPSSMLQLYKDLLHLRKHSQALLHGSYASLDINNVHVFAYLRSTSSERLIVLLNFSAVSQSVSLDVGNITLLLSTTPSLKKGEIHDMKNFSLKPHEGIIGKLIS